MRRWLPLLLLFGFSCSKDDLHETTPRVVVGEERLALGPAVVGGSVTRGLDVRNLGTGRVQVSVEVEGPFSTEAESFSLRGGEARSLAITFSPQETGAFEGVVALLWLEHRVEVELTGEGVEEQDCPPSESCRIIRYEPGLGCVSEWMPDDTPCAEACLEGGVCKKGVCSGVPVDCSDGNPCTLDRCSDEQGCVHVEDPKAVCENDDPCQVPACDPEDGCTSVPVQDGIACGPSDCEASWICKRGKCSREPTPEEGACGEETPCLPKGICRNGECHQSPVDLKPIFSANPPAGHELRFDGVMDSAGRLFWAECSPSSCFLAAREAPGEEGQHRGFRASMFEGAIVGDRGRLMLVDDFVVSSLRRGWIDLFHAADGTRRGGIPLALGLEADADEWEAVEIAGKGRRGYALVEARKAGRPVQGWAISFSVEGGEILWSRPLDGTFEGLALDELGRLVFTLEYANSSSSTGALISLSPEGKERWRHAVDVSPPLAIASGRILDGAAFLRKMEDGAVISSVAVKVPLFSGSAILDLERGFVFGYPLEACPRGRGLCPNWSPHLLSFQSEDASVEWLHPVEDAERWNRTEPVLSDEGSVLFAEAQEDGYYLTEFDAMRKRRFSCVLPGRRYAGAASLHQGTWAAVNRESNRLEIYEVEGRNAAERGWVSTHGDPGRTGSPR